MSNFDGGITLTDPADLHEYLGGPGLCPTTPHPITGETVPLTFGHEFSGTIEEVGEGVDDWVVGDRVSVQPIIYDGTCGACQDNLHNCCWSNGFIGLSGTQLAKHRLLKRS
jgi:threonine dehydrogenase-like Zn-dependent dehydrogenase